ncbi:hypothetical protein QTG54_015371 [Skeletonema marinoi]|uniref:Uncharacterized protein n=1 Tax=Skeletonema marinoi TaxID=267567 RepID=A0AAD9D5L2_9STRA|nr:hypothetical protein QTG54_015371 [Skeletonema marinoi]
MAAIRRSFWHPQSEGF